MKFCDVHKSRLSARNLTARFIITLVYNVVITFLAALLPFFGDFVALVGAIGFIPMDFILPIVMWLSVRKPHKWWSWSINIGIVAFYSIVAILACVGAIRQIHIDVGNYQVGPHAMCKCSDCVTANTYAASLLRHTQHMCTCENSCYICLQLVDTKVCQGHAALHMAFQADRQ